MMKLNTEEGCTFAWGALLPLDPIASVPITTDVDELRY
jgi:hypothetical protein